MVQFIRIMQTGLRNFLRNAWLSTAATAVMTVTLAITLFSFASNSALTSTIKSILNKVDVSIYLNDDIDVNQVKDFQAKLQSLDNVESVKYVSKSDALKQFRQDHANEPKLLEGLSEDDNPLPASLGVKTKDPKKIQGVIDVANSPQYKPLVSSTTYSGDRKGTIDKIVRVSNFLKTTGFIASIIFITISILIIFNTIRMAIFTRRSEIEIMKLVGATNWFIRGPFIFEAALYGIIAAFIATFMMYLMLPFAPRLESFIPDIQTTINFFKGYPLLVLAIELVIGVFIGAFSSLLAMTRYLKL
jgi:cell division transport system permease protein